MRRLFVVANAIGTEETILKLVPFLDSLLRQKKDMVQETSHKAAVPTGTEEEDEILLILAEQIGQLVFCGLVPPQESLVLFPLLEHLAGVEETVVRDKAVESLRGILMLWIGWGDVVCEEWSWAALEYGSSDGVCGLVYGQGVGLCFVAGCISVF